MSDIFNLADTWNAGGTTFSSIKMNVSNGAGGAPVGAAASRVLNLQSNAAPIFQIGIDGKIYTTNEINRVLGTSGYVADYLTTANEAAGPAFTENYQYNSINDGGASSPYSNHVFQHGWNVGPGGGPIIATEPAFAVQWESKFRQGPIDPFGSEWHVRFLDRNSTERRPISIFLPHFAADRTSASFAFQADAYSFQDWAGVVRAGFNTAAGWSWNSGIRYLFNNAPPATMRNAADSSDIPLPYYNASNSLVVAGPIDASGATDPANNSFFSASVTLAANKNIMSLSGANGVTGTVNAFVASVATSDELVNLLQQNGAGAAKQVLRVPAGSKDPFINFNVNGVKDWCIGLDNSDSDAFAISDNFELGTNNRLRIDDNTVQFPTLPPKITPVAIASLPSAATVGAGTRHHVIDALTPVFGATVAASGAVSTPVYSDGTNWKVG